MGIRPNVSAPVAHLVTNESGTLAAEALLAPPQSGSDPGLAVYANLGSSPIAVDQILQGAANLATSQTALNASTSTQVVAARTTRRSVMITNLDTSITVYIGISGVTSSTGQPIPAGFSLTLPFVGAVYAIAASGTPTVSALEIFD